MTSEEHYWWRIGLELKLRKANGDAFQEFFSSVMGKLHGDDFIRVRPYGSLGDKGCDGYLQSSGQIFQCYGAIDGDGGKVDYLVSKMEEDFSKAKEKIPSIMQEWHLAHNLIDGLPIHAVEKLNELEKNNSGIKFGFIGLEGFVDRLFKLPTETIVSLLGPAATNLDAQNMQAAELRDLVAAVATAADETPTDLSVIKPVPADKLELNQLPGHWRSLIAGGWQNAHHVGTYLENHHDPLMGETIANAFRGRYQYLKTQNLTPGAIMSSLYEMVTGTGQVAPERQVAAQALLAYLFESCDIFEDGSAGSIK